jgi:hypothetical protein
MSVQGGAKSIILSAHAESIILSAPPAESMILSAPPAESVKLSARAESIILSAGSVKQQSTISCSGKCGNDGGGRGNSGGGDGFDVGSGNNDCSDNSNSNSDVDGDSREDDRAWRGQEGIAARGDATTSRCKMTRDWQGKRTMRGRCNKRRHNNQPVK